MSRLTLLSNISRSFLTFAFSAVFTVSASLAEPTDSLNANAAATTTTSAADPAAIKEGESLFKANCKSCHKIDQDAVGPALKGVSKRRKPEWIRSWVHNNNAFRATGDKDAIAIYEKWNKSEMTAFPTLTDAQIDNIVTYVENATPAVDPNKPPVDEKVTPEANPYQDVVLGLVVVVLLLVLITLIVFLRVIKKYLKEKEAGLSAEDKELVNQKFDIKAVVKSKGFISIVAILFVIIAVRACWLGMMSIGVEQNYQPVQPIHFSHKLHAGDNKINCNYCHTGAYKGKQANIPSLNICMNCHTSVKKGPQYGETEIAKVVQAYNDGTPIRWVRIHNLPDLAYFNHSQHTKVAGIECQKCHGPIEEMEVVKQYSNLTMGWCINCHRETAVNSQGNEYYDRLLKVHDEAKRKGDMTAEEMGGLDCSKCHY